MRRRKIRKYGIWIVAPAMVLFLGTALYGALGGMSGGNDQERMASLETAIRRAAVSCYAAEGRYPETVDYLVEKYGVVLDGRFAVHYSAFAPNLPPDVAVVTKPTEEEIWGTKR